MSPSPSVVVAGGIGSGKSTVMGLLSELGWSVINSDQVGHEVLLETPVIEAVAARWPLAVVGGRVDRSTLASLVFSTPEELSALEDITHPRIVGRISERVNRLPKPLAIEVSVLQVARSGWGPLAIVHASAAVRRQRALERGMTAADVESRMAVQPSDIELLGAADLVIDNQGTVEELTQSVRQLDRWARSE
jgi:dephospho-CoA kinase